MYQESNLEQLPWVGNNTSPSINKVLADQITPVPLGDSLGVSICSTKPFGGALVSCKRAIPIISGSPLPYYMAEWFVKPSQLAVRFNRVYECDTLFIYPAAPTDVKPGIKQWYDGSFQLNLAEGGMCQIDKVASHNSDGTVTFTWKDTGYKRGPLLADTWTRIQIRYKIDWTKQVLNVLSLLVGDGTPFVISDPDFKDLPANLNNWSTTINDVPRQPFISQQAQLCIDDTPAAYEVLYRLNGYWSDKPIQ
jgi:hypothetical protein